MRAIISTALDVSHLASTISILSFALFAYERSVEPLYGSVPTGYYLPYVISAATLISAFTPALGIRPFGYSLFAAAITSYRVAALSARHCDATWGPVITHLLVLAPVFYLAVPMHHKSLFSSKGTPIGEQLIKSQLLCWLPWLAVRHYLSTSPYLLSISDDKLFFRLAAIAIAPTVISWTSSTTTSTPKSTRFLDHSTIWGFFLSGVILLSIINVPAGPRQTNPPYTHLTYPIRILSSTRSTTGLIVVGEALPAPGGFDSTDDTPHSVRYLRASHSLLGGVWTHERVVTIDDAPPFLDSQGEPLGDSIYSAFNLQEAARLADNIKGGKAENALIIGLGTGISASAFHHHNIATTIVEIDPAVYTAARQYFGLPDPGEGNIFLEDARGWVAQRGRSTSSKPFDIVIHDCFSGGGVPEHIFTVEFWEDLKGILSPEGVVAVNFAGHLGSASSRSILLTLQRAFGQCRGFHDAIEEYTEEQYPDAFINMVFFCTPSKQPLTFRPAEDADYLNSHLRRHVLSTLPRREVNLAHVLGDVPLVSESDKDAWVLTDAKNPLGDWQKEEAMKHWKVMRGVMPDMFWETY